MFLIAKSTEFFISTLTRQSFDDQADDTVSELSYDHVSDFVQSNEVLQFLHDILPPKVTYAEALVLMQNNDLDFLSSDDDAAEAVRKKSKPRPKKKSTNQAKTATATSVKSTTTTEAREKKASKKEGKPKVKKQSVKDEPAEVVPVIKTEPEVDVHFEDEESNHVSGSLVEFEVEQTTNDPAVGSNENSNSIDTFETSQSNQRRGSREDKSDHDYFS